MNLIPSIELNQDELLRRLRGLIDIVADPDLSIKDPAAYTQAYVRLLNLIARHPKKMKSKHVLHNLGEVRVNFLKDLTGNDYVRPDYKNKSRAASSLHEARREMRRNGYENG